MREHTTRSTSSTDQSAFVAATCLVGALLTIGIGAVVNANPGIVRFFEQLFA